MARAELEKRGLTETEVRARLLENGIDVDAIPPTEYAQYQGRVMAILNQMQAEKSRNLAAAQADTTGIPAVPDMAIPQTTVQEMNAENILSQNTAAATAPAAADGVYGHSLFTGNAMEIFRTTDGAQAPDTYVLGEGDEVHISIFGSSQTEIHQRIAQDGSIQPAGSSKIFLKGLTLAQGRQAVKNKLSQHYSFRQDQIAVTITTARTLTVSIYGEVGIPGGFTISALNTAFNALAAAGGPTEIGSVRNIQRSRAGKTERLDLYKFMMGESGSVLYDLQNNDVLFVPVAQKIVRIEGAVNRPMRYEMADGETLADLIRYAGGISADAYADYVSVERLEDGEKKLEEYNLNNVLNGGLKVALSAGDIVRVKTNPRVLENYVAIGGEVYFGGRFNLDRNRSLKALLENAQPSYSARKDYVFVERMLPDSTVQVLTIPYPGTGSNPDFRLQARDSVSVLGQAAYRDLASISVNGAVRKPFTKDFGLNEKMTVSQAIEYAGGIKSTTYPVAYIFRQDVTNPEKMEYIQVNLNKDGDKLLKPGDNLNVYDNSTYTNIGEVRVSGAVKTPVNVTYDSTLTVHDLLTMAGGFETGAAYDRVQVFRMDISKKDEVKFKEVTLQVDENYNLAKGDFQLQPYDHIVVRMTPNFSTGRTVEINGRVRYPGVYVLDDTRTQLSEVLVQAGGLLDDAEPYAVLFRPFNGRGNIGIDLGEIRSNRGNTQYDPILMEGDVINVVRRENTVFIRETGTLMSQYIPEEFSATEKAVIYQGRHSAKWYIRKNAGGFTKDADKNSVTVTKPNGQSEGTRHFLWWRIYPKVEPGSVISLRIDDKKREELAKPKEKVDWSQVAASSLSTLTSIVSMILLIERLN
ncbi:MAG: SLBB domain-containing protein [Bacteroidales bacterium]|nr:SLBB domain-containing protein [Bacteroidales bacterium]